MEQGVIIGIINLKRKNKAAIWLPFFMYTLLNLKTKQ